MIIILLSICCITTLITLILVIKSITENNTSKFDEIEELLENYWQSLDKEDYMLAITRYKAYKTKLLQEYNTYEFEYNNYSNKKYRSNE